MLAVLCAVHFLSSFEKFQTAAVGALNPLVIANASIEFDPHDRIEFIRNGENGWRPAAIVAVVPPQLSLDTNRDILSILLLGSVRETDELVWQ